MVVDLFVNTRYKPRGGPQKGIYLKPKPEADLGTLDFNNLVYLAHILRIISSSMAKIAILEAVNNTKDNGTS